MKNNPLLNHIEVLQKLCLQASKEEMPAMWLYQHQGRTQFFMLESLSRLFYKGLKNINFKTWYDFFKKYEDLMGVINNYEELLEGFKENSKTPIEVMNFWKYLKDELIDNLEKQFKKDGYLEKHFSKLTEMLDENNINYNEKTILHIEKAIHKEIKKITKNLSANDYQFTDIESQVHELRRKIRWIGIYSQSLNGLIVLKENKTKYEWEEKYLTESVLNSPYHKLVINKSFEKNILLNKKQFMAFTWLIAQLGELKEFGLNIESLTLAIVETENISHEQAMLKANKIMNSKISIEDILQNASKIAKDFFEFDQIANGLFANE